jgi:hypothetical protein
MTGSTGQKKLLEAVVFSFFTTIGACESHESLKIIKVKKKHNHKKRRVQIRYVLLI